MREKYQDESELRKVKNGLFVTITTVISKQDLSNLEHQSECKAAGKEFLKYLADPESLINRIYQRIFEENRDTIEKAREKFPEPESLDHLQKLLEMYP